MRYFLTILMLTFSLVTFGHRGFDNEQIPYILKIGSMNCNLDSVTLQKIKPFWIKKMEVLKNEGDTLIYGDKPPKAILIHPERKYYQDILLMLAENNGLNINSEISKQIKKQEFIIRAGIGFDRYKIENTTLLQIIVDFGLSYKHNSENSSVCILEYEKLGLTFYFDENNSNALLQCIEFRKPFLGTTDTGIRLGKSTMLDVKEVYEELDWFSTNGAEYWWSEHPGIEFGVLRDLKLPQYPLNEELYEQKKIIEINVVNENRQ